MIFYFTGTGNSEYVAARIAEVTGDCFVSMADCLNNKKLSWTIKPGERLGIVCPVYFLGIPSLVVDFLEQVKLHFDIQPYVYCVTTYGTFVGGAQFCIKKLLKEKTMDVNAFLSVRMVDVWTPIFNLTKPKSIKKSEYIAEKQIERVCEIVKACKDVAKAERAFVSVVSKIYHSSYDSKRRTKHFFLIGDACISCGLCAKDCPVSAIRMIDGKPYWESNQCVACLRCLHHCPKFAIQYGKATQSHGQYVNPFAKKLISKMRG